MGGFIVKGNVMIEGVAYGDGDRGSWRETLFESTDDDIFIYAYGELFMNLETCIYSLTLPKKRRCWRTVRSMNSMLCCGHSPISSLAFFRLVAMSQPPTSA